MSQKLKMHPVGSVFSKTIKLKGYFAEGPKNWDGIEVFWEQIAVQGQNAMRGIDSYGIVTKGTVQIEVMNFSCFVTSRVLRAPL